MIEHILLKDALIKIEIPSDRITPDWVFDLLSQPNVLQNAKWYVLAMRSFSLEEQFPDFESIIRRFLNRRSVPPQETLDSIDRCIPAMPIRLAENISRVLKAGNNIKSFRLIDTNIQDDAVVACLADGIRACPNLRTIELFRLRMNNDRSQDEIAESISSNRSIYSFRVCGYWGGGNDLLRVSERLGPQIRFDHLMTYQDPRVFSVLGKLLHSRGRCIRELDVCLSNEEKSRTELDPNHIDSFIDALGQCKNLGRVKRLGIIGHCTFTREQLKKFWTALRRMKFEEIRFKTPQPMPDRWEQDFAVSLPELDITKLAIGKIHEIDYNRMIADALKKNYAVQEMTLPRDQDVAQEIRFICGLNWAGRRVEQLEPNEFNSALWPNVLERINVKECKMLVYNNTDNADARRSHLTKNDILFYFLKQNVQKMWENRQQQAATVPNKKRKLPP